MDPGSVVASYSIVRTLGSGGMGDVYEARGLNDAQVVAIKILRQDLVKNNEATTRFAREAQLASALKSPHAARIYEVGHAATGQPYIVMEYLRGNDLMNEIDSRGALPVEEAVYYVVQACHAMMEAHALGIVHRDLKPPNLFLAEEAQQRIVKVLDFGISKMTQLLDGHLTSTQSSFGSPLYMSPEQIRSTKLVDGRSDLWSLGVILYEAITGEPPFIAETPGALAVVISIEPHVPPSQRKSDIPSALDTVIGRALEKSPANRYQSARELADALQAFLPTGYRPPLPMNSGLAVAPAPAPDHARTNLMLRPSVPPPTAQSTAVPNNGVSRPVASTVRLRREPLAPAQHQSSAGRGRTVPMPRAISEGPAAGPASQPFSYPTARPLSQAAGSPMAEAPAASKPSLAVTTLSTRPNQSKDRTAIVLGATIIPLGLLAFAFAIWLYAQRNQPPGPATSSPASLNDTRPTRQASNNPIASPPSATSSAVTKPGASSGK